MRGRGRGEYFKNLYGRGRGRERGHSNVPRDNGDASGSASARGVKRNRSEIEGSSESLVDRLRRMDGRSYPAYRDIQGSWDYNTATLTIDHVQSDPYASPSKLRLYIPHSVARYPEHLLTPNIRKVALCDYLLRQLNSILPSLPRGYKSSGWHGAKGGEISVDRPGKQVLERSAVVVKESGIEVRFTTSLPAQGESSFTTTIDTVIINLESQGRTILGDPAAEIFRDGIPKMINALLYDSQDKRRLQSFVESIEDQEDLRRQINNKGLVAFVRNGAILPRASGVSDLPLQGSHVVSFQSPPNLERTFVLPNGGEVRGMGIPAGITMVAGGGFHGKSTLLDALAVGCYNHIPGDGREFVTSSSHIVSVEGEDGRSIQRVDISPFISNLPGGISTSDFSTKDASGSTSMAAGVIEAIEVGADTLLFDEDTCATNFLIRDRRMQKLISVDPITPLIFKVRALFKDHGCSSVLVIGGCGDYCDVADLVLEMRNYQCYDITERARQVAQEIPSVVSSHEVSSFGQIQPRQLQCNTLPPYGSKTVARKLTAIQITNEETLNLSALKQLGTRSLREVLTKMDGVIDEGGLDALVAEDRLDGFLARPRAVEVGMAVNRLRSASFRAHDSNKMEE
ncbi:hypothetical protein K474DRAFT_1775012 [Panus rudis PR-1116 ss-1]|nr:hypothetical protein K474DRAFT_1775012 [Panus rudis PR-1116 ss-1]